MRSTNTNSKEIKAVVFDMAGTTIDEGKTVYESVRLTLEGYGISLSLHEVMKEIGGMNKKEGIRRLMQLKWGEVDTDTVDEAAEIFRTMLEEAYLKNDGIQEMVGATNLFSHLQENNIKVILDTGYFRSTADLLIGKMGWDEQRLIDYSVTSDEVTAGRPSPMMIQKALAYFNIENASQIVKVGDTKSDVEEGINAGCKYVVGIISPLHSKEELMAMGATHAIYELAELKAIIDA